MEYREVLLEDIADLTVGFVGKTATHYVHKGEGIRFLRSMNVEPFRINFNDEKFVDEPFHKSIKKSELCTGDVVIVRTGKPGACAVIPEKDEEWNCSDLVVVKPNHEKVNSTYLAAYVNLAYGVINAHLVGAVQQHFNVGAAKKLKIKLPDMDNQRKIADVIDKINDKIEINNRVNRNMSEQAQAIYQQMFVVESNSYRKTCKAEDYFDIGIGKTPPRKEKEWFSSDSSDRVWISISDMGSCGTYIDNSSEYLTHEAVERFNVRIVPNNTVLLSFKLTVGRIAITVGETTTNEAIAHFKTGKGNIVEYLYCYLRAFDFGALGSTSSIGTAVNSKTIKAMEFVVPEEKELQEFYDVVNPMFEQIKKNQFENQRLIMLRDSLLPKLMSGELDVSNIDFDKEIIPEIFGTIAVEAEKARIN